MVFSAPASLQFWCYARTPGVTSRLSTGSRLPLQPEAYTGGADRLFDANGKLANDGTRKFLQGFMHAFAAWITANKTS